MFTGIIEATGKVEALDMDRENLNITISSPISDELKIDQSLAHDGVCLTVVEQSPGTHTITAIKETLVKSNIGQLQVGDEMNLERAMAMNGRLDGHIVQGHVDQVGRCTSLEDQDGSWLFTFSYEEDFDNVTIEKGSITVNGVSLTVVNSKAGQFSVAIIPYTLEHTNFKGIKPGSLVNLEFDVIGKYVARIMSKK